MGDRYFAGIDVGASATKAAIIDATGRIRGAAVVPSGINFEEAGERAFNTALAQAGFGADRIAHVLSTGYGRRNVAAAQSEKTEISCHARGAHHSFRQAIQVIDIGGQDNKIIEVNEAGKQVGFKMNRKCAAGTGAFIEELAHRMGVPLEQMEPLARESRARVEIGSFCTVFSATEILSLIRQGAAVEDIVKAVFRSVAKRVAEMGIAAGKVVATGGVVAHNPIILELLAEVLETEVVAPPAPQLAGALGAALFARDTK